MTTHAAVATLGLKKPLGVIQVPTLTPRAEQVRVKVLYTASTPLDLHQNDGGLVARHPQVLGDSVAGEVVETGPNVSRLQVGDKVFGFVWRSDAERGQQEYVTVEEWLLGKIPRSSSPQQAVTLPNNFVTVFHALTKDLSITLPHPKPSVYTPLYANKAFLIWGGASSVGQYAIQILRYYGYTNILATASPRHHAKLRGYGATQIIDYRGGDEVVVRKILETVGNQGVHWVLDCIGSLEGSIKLVTKVARHGTRVAILLPVVVRDSAEGVDPIYESDVEKVVEWGEGVVARGVRTHFYLENEFFKYYLQPVIMHEFLRDGVVEPNAQRTVEGSTLLERAQKALNMLRSKEVRGERLVWRVSEE